MRIHPDERSKRPAAAELRTREHLTPGEVDALVEAAKANRHGHRDATMILVAFRHGLRAAEVCDLRWDQVEFDAAVLHVRRVKNGISSTHPIRGDELRALRRLQRESETSPFVFVSERGSPFTTAGFARMIERAAASAGLDLKAHPHMLRHACGYALANKGHDTRAIQAWLGHRSITSTAVYTALAPTRRGRCPGRGRQGEPARASGRHHDPGRLPPQSRQKSLNRRRARSSSPRMG
jgi:integrase